MIAKSTVRLLYVRNVTLLCSSAGLFISSHQEDPKTTLTGFQVESRKHKIVTQKAEPWIDVPP